MMNKVITAALLFILSGCLAATPPMGASKEAGGSLDKDAATDAFVPPPVVTEAPPAPPPATPPAAAPATGSSAEGTPPRDDHSFAIAAPGPLDPKSDQTRVTVSLLCPRFHRLKSALIPPPEDCFLGLQTLSGPDKETFTFKDRLERAQDDPPTLWNPEPDGYQVRLVYYPAGKEGWEGSFVDTTVTASDGNNVSFPEITVGPGLIYILLFEPAGPPEKTDDYQPSFKPFADQPAYEAFLSSGQKFLGIGMIQLMAPTSDSAMAATGPTMRLPRLLLRQEPDMRAPKVLKNVHPSQP
jgi:hypothetical protein